jgi:hypothetical protein
LRNDRLAEQAVAVVDAMPDAILTGPENYARIYQQLTRTIPLIAMTEDMVGAVHDRLQCFKPQYR